MKKTQQAIKDINQAIASIDILDVSKLSDDAIRRVEMIIKDLKRVKSDISKIK